jgi:hypothetical protein
MIAIHPRDPAAGAHPLRRRIGDLKSAVARMRRQGATLADPGVTPGRALFSRLRDPDGVQIEIMAVGPDSQQRRTMNAWKD